MLGTWDLTERVDVQQRSLTYDEDHPLGPSPNWTTVATSVWVGITETMVTVTSDDGKRSVVKAYRVRFPDRRSYSFAAHRFIWGATVLRPMQDQRQPGRPSGVAEQSSAILCEDVTGASVPANP